MRLADAVKLVERGIDDNSIAFPGSPEHGIAVRSLLEVGRRVLAARPALRKVMTIIDDNEHLNQMSLDLEDK
jgi:hypothetical protein